MGEIPVASAHDHLGIAEEKSDFRVGWCLSQAALVRRDVDSNEGLLSLWKSLGIVASFPFGPLANPLRIDSIFVLWAVGRVFAQTKTVCMD